MKFNRLAGISFLTVTPGLLLIAQMNPPTPPLHRASTVMLGGRVDSLFVKGDTAWFGRESDVIAWDLKRSIELWSHTLETGRHAENIAVGGGIVFVSTDPKADEADTALIALDAGTGKPRWSLPRKGRSSAIGVGDGVIYTELAPFHISAIDASNGNARWTTELTERNEDKAGNDYGELDAVLVVSDRVAVNCGNVTYVLDAESRKVLCHNKDSYIFDASLVATDNVLLVPVDNGTVARELSTGRKLWNHPTIHCGHFAAVFQGRFLVLDHGRLHALNPKDGTVAWSHLMGPTNSSG